MSQIILFSNNATTTLAGAISNSALTANLAAGSGVEFPSPTGGQYFCMTFVDAATGLLNEIVHVTDVTGDVITMVRAQEGTTALAWGAGDIAANFWTAGQAGAMQQVTSAQRPNYAFNVASPPSSPIALNVGDQLNITFSGQASVPMHVASSPGVYKVTGVITASSGGAADWSLEPNDVAHSNSFSSYALENTDGSLSSLGSATTLAGYANLTVSPYLGSVPTSIAATASQSAFTFDLFFGPSGSDTINDIGPNIFDIILSTATAAKMAKYTGGITGGGAIGFSKWNDTSTPWTSLGTLVPVSATSVSGVVIVERLA